MDKIIVVFLTGLFVWPLGAITVQDPYTGSLGAEPNMIEMIMGIIAATVGCHLFLYRSSTG